MSAEKDERPNITTRRGAHRQQCNYSGYGDVTTWAWAGQVRRCTHGRIQLAFAVPGSIPAYWRDLSPIWTPVLYRRASKALTRVTPPGSGRG